MKRKILTLIMALAMVLTLIPAAGAQMAYAADAVDEFTDTTEKDVNATAYSSIYWAVGEGIIKGFSDGTFRPTDSCTREQFVVMIWRLEGKPSAQAQVRFSDIESSRSTFRAIQWAVNRNIIKGFSDGSFRPENTVTRQQIAIMLWRMAGKPSAGSSTEFTDVASSTSGYEAIRWGAAAGLIKGFSDGSFGPEKDCQRQQIAIFLTRYAKSIEGKDTTAPEEKKAGEAEKPAKDKYYLLSSLTGSSSQKTYKYDSMGRLTEVINIKSQKTMYSVEYNDNGWSVTDISRNRISDYDKNGNMIREIGYDNSGAVRSWNEYEYDEKGNVTNWIDCDKEGKKRASYKTEYTYDQNGNVIKETFYNNNGSVRYWYDYKLEYDQNKNIIKETATKEIAPTGGSAGSAGVSGSGLGGIPVLPITGKEGTFTFEYDSSGNIIKYTRNINDIVSTTEYLYDSDGNLIKEIPNGSKTSWYEYEYDANGNKTKFMIKNPSYPGTWEYSYIEIELETGSNPPEGPSAWDYAVISWV